MSLRNSLNEEIGFVEDDLHLEMDEITQAPMIAMKAAIQQYDNRIKTLLEEDIELAQKLKSSCQYLVLAKLLVLN